jgi:4a-hydroxytetrahydrobiopterin dehydratase
MLTDTKLKDADMWKENQNLLTRKFKFDDFKQALEFVNKVGELAEQANHHPDIRLGYGYAQISLMTHSDGSVTEKDKSLSRQIDLLLEGHK